MCSADMLQSFSYVCRMFPLGSRLFQRDFHEHEPNQTEESETVGFVEANVENKR